MIGGADFAVFFGELLACFYRAAEFDSMAIALGPFAGGFHFETCITQGTAVRPKGFIVLLVSGIDGNVWSWFHLFDNESVKLSDVVCLVGNEYSPFFETVSSLQFFDKAECRLLIGNVVWQRFLDQTYPLFGNDGVRSETPEEDHVLLFAVYDLAGVVAQRCPRITFWLF